MKFSNIMIAGSALAIAASAAPASAATVMKDLTLKSNVGTVVFSLNFDNAASFYGSTSGVQLISTDLFAPLQIGYNKEFDSLTLVGGNGVVVEGSACSNSAGSFCSFISNISTAPSSNFLLKVDNNSSLTFGENVSVTENVAAVPEPATWGMMLAGFGVVGVGMRSRRKQTARVTYA